LRSVSLVTPASPRASYRCHLVSRGCAPGPLHAHGSFLAAVDRSLRSQVRRVTILLAFLIAIPASAEHVRAFWVSPDWLLSGDRATTHAEAAAVVDRAVRAVQAQGGNAVFVETLLRGQLVGPCPAPGKADLPVYPLCRWTWPVQGGLPQDLLSLFVEAGKKHGVQVHAWVHCFYWRSDNNAFRRPWHDGPTIWDDLLVDYLKEVGAHVTHYGRRRRTEELVKALAGGFDWRRFERAAADWGVGTFEGLFNNLVRDLVKGDGPPPMFLATNPRGEVHYGMEFDRILAVYVNPEDPRVTARVADVVDRIVASHPGLAGVHLDHVRFPKGPFGSPGAFAKFPSALRISVYDVPKALVADVAPALIRKREDAITAMVQKIRASLPKSLQLTAAVYPTYYAARNGDVLTPEAYIGQDWARWPVDYVVPMIYHPSAAHVEKLLAQCRAGGRAAGGAGAPPVYPGISSLPMARAWGRSRPWVFFDFEGFGGMLEGIPGSALKTMGLKDKMF
jgi:uncharacterized lipoprotein YddW (UPF0748 family)